jgi:Na+-transporting methylmalonyl-CoA/oxaloacetate decarboxylase gamma subunit
LAFKGIKMTESTEKQADLLVGADEIAHLDWAEKLGLENLRYSLKIADVLAKEAQTTLTVVLAACGAALGWAAKDGIPYTITALGMAVVSIYLMLVAAVIVLRCLKIAAIWPPTNDPENYFFEGYKTHSLLDLKRGSIRVTQRSVDLNRQRNAHVADWIDRTRLAIVATPIVFAVASWLVWVLGFAALG